MSNLCYTTLTLRGSEAALSKLQQALPGLNPPRTRCQEHFTNGFTQVCFHNFVPVPESLLAGDASELRAWLVAEWGCGHAAGTGQAKFQRRGPDLLIVEIITRWMPPSGVIEAMSQKHPAVTFEFACKADSTGHVSISVMVAGSRREGPKVNGSR
jgi:hypothetical protein